MTYFGFLLLFLVLPLGVLLTRIWRQRALERLPWKALILVAVIALVYTTPWDNYLVANAVWWYDKRLVTGLTLGWVPLEEYFFFILQPLLVGVWLATLERQPTTHAEAYSPPRMRLIGLTLSIAAGIVGLSILLNGWPSGRYLGLELVWGIAPLALQLAFGADILWQSRHTLALAIVPSTLYLSAADTIAIASGTWTINPAYSLGIRIAGILPIEECLFFVLTSTLIAFSVVLLESPQAAERMSRIITATSRRSRPLRSR
jgi:lycopene cyclase domain-containing protein